METCDDHAISTATTKRQDPIGHAKSLRHRRLPKGSMHLSDQGALVSTLWSTHLLETIFCKLDVRSLGRVACCCKHLYAVQWGVIDLRSLQQQLDQATIKTIVRKKPHTVYMPDGTGRDVLPAIISGKYMIESQFKAQLLNADHMSHLAAAMRKSSSSLRHLSIRNTNMEGSTIEWLCAGLRDNETVLSIDLSGSMIGENGAYLLADVLVANNHLRYLFLNGKVSNRRDKSCGGLNDTGASAIAESLNTNSGLTFLSLNCNRIKLRGAAKLAQALVVNKSLRELRLMCCAIGDLGAQAFARALNINRTLRVLDIAGNGIRGKGAAHLHAMLAQNRKIRRFVPGMTAVNGLDFFYSDRTSKKKLLYQRLMQYLVPKRGSKVASEIAGMVVKMFNNQALMMLEDKDAIRALLTSPIDVLRANLIVQSEPFLLGNADQRRSILGACICRRIQGLCPDKKVAYTTTGKILENNRMRTVVKLLMNSERLRFEALKLLNYRQHGPATSRSTPSETSASYARRDEREDSAPSPSGTLFASNLKNVGPVALSLETKGPTHTFFESSPDSQNSADFQNALAALRSLPEVQAQNIAKDESNPKKPSTLQRHYPPPAEVPGLEDGRFKSVFDSSNTSQDSLDMSVDIKELHTFLARHSEHAILPLPSSSVKDVSLPSPGLTGEGLIDNELLEMLE